MSTSGTTKQHRHRAEGLVRGWPGLDKMYRGARTCARKLQALGAAERRLGELIAEEKWTERTSAARAKLAHKINGQRQAFERACVCSKKGR